MKQLIIALTGLANVGKDTVADLLVEHAGFRKLAFADALRGEVAHGFGVDLSVLTDRHTKETPTLALSLLNGPREFLNAIVAAHVSDPASPMTPHDFARLQREPRSPRQILQWWGTEYRRAQSANYWVSTMLKKINYHRQEAERRFVISDCRFENEADLVRAMGGQIWRITREGIDASNTAEGQHASATTGDRLQPTLTLHNLHDIRHLQGIVRDAFFELEWPERARVAA